MPFNLDKHEFARLPLHANIINGIQNARPNKQSNAHSYRAVGSDIWIGSQRVDTHTAGTVTWTNHTITENGSAGMTVLIEGSWDDNYFALNPPFALTFNGVSYAPADCYISSNSAFNFGGGDDNYWYDLTGGGTGGGYSVPSPTTIANQAFDPRGPDGGEGPSYQYSLPSLYIMAWDVSVQVIYTKTAGTAGSRQFRVRYEGNNRWEIPFYITDKIIWEAVFYEDQPGIIDIVSIRDPRNTLGITGVSSGTEWIGTRSLSQPVGYLSEGGNIGICQLAVPTLGSVETQYGAPYRLCTLPVGECTLFAYDQNYRRYAIVKLTAHRATIKRCAIDDVGAPLPPYIYEDGASVGWVYGVPPAGSVSLYEAEIPG